MVVKLKPNMPMDDLAADHNSRGVVYLLGAPERDAENAPNHECERSDLGCVDQQFHVVFCCFCALFVGIGQSAHISEGDVDHEKFGFE